MPDILPTPRMIKDIYLKIGANTYQAAVSECRITSPDPVIVQGGTPTAQYGDVPAAGRMVKIVAVQDWESVTSLCNYLLANEGTKATLIYSPRAGSTIGWSVDVILSAPDIGGPVNKFGEFTKTFPAVTKPVQVVIP